MPSPERRGAWCGGASSVRPMSSRIWQSADAGRSPSNDATRRGSSRLSASPARKQAVQNIVICGRRTLVDLRRAMDRRVMQHPDGGLRSVLHLDLSQSPLEMHLHGALRDLKQPGNLFVRVSARDEGENFPFSAGKRVVSRSFLRWLVSL